MIQRSTTRHTIDPDGTEHFEIEEAPVSEPVALRFPRDLTPEEADLVTNAATTGYRTGYAAAESLYRDRLAEQARAQLEDLRAIREALSIIGTPATDPTAPVPVGVVDLTGIIDRLERVATSVETVAGAVSAPTVRRVVRNEAGEIVAVTEGPA